jgi:23S rRNA pseudouridine2605 synthase
MRLARTSFAGITSEGLLPGQWRHLTAEELLALRKEHGVPRRIRSAVGAAPRTAAPRGALVPRGGADPIELRRGRTRATSDRPPRRAEPSSTRAPRHAEPSAPRSSRHAEPSPSDRPPRRAEPMPPGRPPRRRGAARR